MPVEMTTVALLLGAGLVAGTLNSIAGGGSLMTIPLLIFIGLPPTVANATNRIAIFIGGIGATQSFHRRGLIPLPWVRLGLPPALAGVVFGIWGATRIGDVAFERVLAVVLVAAAAWIIWHPVTPPDHGDPEPPLGTRRWVMTGAFFLVGVYSGFIQAGVGFVFLALMSANGLDLVRGNAFKAAMILVFTGVAVVLFALSDMLDWIAGLNLAAGQFFGAKLGVHLQVLRGQAWVRNVLTVAILAFAVRLLIGG